MRCGAVQCCVLLGERNTILVHNEKMENQYKRCVPFPSSLFLLISQLLSLDSSSRIISLALREREKSKINLEK